VTRGRPPQRSQRGRRPGPKVARDVERDFRSTKGRDDLGGDQVEGRRAVLELLRAGRRRARSVMVSADATDDVVLAEIAELAGSALRIVPSERVVATARTDTHQGVVARAEPLTPVDLDALLDQDNAFIVALDGVTDPRNLGAVLRVAETAGVTGVILPRHRSARITPTVAKAAAGAIEYLPMALVSGIPAALSSASRAGVWSVGLDERGDQSVFSLSVADQPIVVVFGAEGQGLARLTRDRCEVVAHIPMHGMLASLNVSTAAAIACHEIARGRAR
jgi:23S rRNA (guanosine2251-2'-O)-methyltransferase